MTPSAKRRDRRRRALATAAAPIPGAPAAPPEYHEAASMLKSLSGFDGANNSTRRGWVYWPTLDSKKELDTYSRTELLRKSRWLRANTGLPNRICSGLSDMIGYLTPLSASGDDQWDDYCDKHWADRAGEASVIDASGSFDIMRMQLELNKAAFGDGDILPVLIRGESGAIQLANYEAHQLANPPDAPAGWIDGVRVNKFRRHVAYGLRGEDGVVRQIAAANCLYYSHPGSLGQIRPPTILKHAINHMIDISEILADVKLTIKVAAQMGLYVKNQKGNSGGYSGAMAIAGSLRNELMEPGDGTPENPASSYQIEDFYRAQGGIANLPEGAEIGTIADARPHPNQVNLIEYLVRDIAWGVGVAPEIIWNIEKLRGANNRLVNADLNRWISCRLLRLRAWMKRFRAIWVSNEITAGRLKEPAGAGLFWKASFLPQANLTADKGREGNLNIEFIKNHLRSLSDHYAEEGKDWQTELRQIARERATLRELGLALDDLGREQAANPGQKSPVRPDKNTLDPESPTG